MDCESTIVQNGNQEEPNGQEISSSGTIEQTEKDEYDGGTNPQANQPGKMRIDPHQLLTCLNVLLNDNGGIRSNSEVKRVAGLMGKYSKKLVSKCIYINILEATDSELLDEFYKEAGWDLICSWLAESVDAVNWPLTEQLLELLLVSPITVDRLKQNNTPKLVKDLSKESKQPAIKALSERVVDHWKIVVGVGNSSMPPQTQEPPCQPTPPNEAETIPPDEPLQIDEPDSPPEPIPIKPMKRQRAKRGVPVARGKRKRGRPSKAESLSYAELLNEGIDTSNSKSEPPIKITIRNGAKVLAKVSSRKSTRSRQLSIESTTDSDDNVPLSVLKKEVENVPSFDENTDKSSAEDLPEKSLDEPASHPPKVITDDSVSEEPTAQKSPKKTSSTNKAILPKDKIDAVVSNNKSKNKSEDVIDKSKSKDRHRDRSKHSHRDKDRSSQRDKRKDSDKDRHSRSSDKSKDHKHGSSSRSDKDISESKKSQAKKDEATLHKVKPFSTDGLARIPKKSPTSKSFMDALSAGDGETTDLKKPAVKTKTRAFRSSGLLDDIAKPPGVAGKRVLSVNEPKQSSVLSAKRSIPTELPSEKRNKVSAEPCLADRPGGIKLISPKRPSFADDGGFMAALTATTGDKKKLIRKRRPSDADQRPDKLKLHKSDSDSKVNTSSEVEDLSSPLIKEEALLSPTSVKPILNFYKERDTEVEAPKESSETDIKPKVEIDEDSKPTAMEETPTVVEEYLPEVLTVPAPAQEDYETIDVVHSMPQKLTKSALIYHREANRKRKNVQWKTEDNLKEVFFFPMDENERVNVNHVKFQDMIDSENAKEKELMGKNRFGVSIYEQGPASETCTEYASWKLYPVTLNGEPSTFVHGTNSREKHTQAQREHNTMGAFFNPAMLPDTPSEPDPEMVTRTETIIIPLSDVTGSEIYNDHRDIAWPEPNFNPPEVPFAAPGPGPNPPMPAADGGHWVVGSHPANRFGAPLFNGPGNQGPHGQPPFGGGQHFGEDLRGGWGHPGHPPPNEFRVPPMMMSAGPPHMPMSGHGPRMVGPQGPGMGGRGGGPMRFKRNNWGPPPASGPRPCYHFMHGHCRNGSNCRFSHAQPR